MERCSAQPGAVRPAAFTTLCAGAPAGAADISLPTSREFPGRPSSVAIAPYVSTLPLGIELTILYTDVSNVSIA